MTPKPDPSPTDATSHFTNQTIDLEIAGEGGNGDNNLIVLDPNDPLSFIGAKEAIWEVTSTSDKTMSPTHEEDMQSETMATQVLKLPTFETSTTPCASASPRASTSLRASAPPRASALLHASASLHASTQPCASAQVCASTQPHASTSNTNARLTTQAAACVSAQSHASTSSSNTNAGLTTQAAAHASASGEQ